MSRTRLLILLQACCFLPCAVESEDLVDVPGFVAASADAMEMSVGRMFPLEIEDRGQKGQWAQMAVW